MEKILKFPKVIQKYDYDCGASALQSVFKYYGIKESYKKILELLEIETESGADIPQIVKIAKEYNLDVEAKENMKILDLKKSINMENPILVEIQMQRDNDLSWRKSNKWGHYVVCIGYDENNLYFNDPLYERRRFLSFKEMNERWHGYATKKRIFNKWGMICRGVIK